MSAPKLIGSGRVSGMSENHVQIDAVRFDATEWHQGYYDVLCVDGAVRVTIEPADADPQPDPDPITGEDADINVPVAVARSDVHPQFIGMTGRIAGRGDQLGEVRVRLDADRTWITVPAAWLRRIPFPCDQRPGVALAAELLGQIKRTAEEHDVARHREPFDNIEAAEDFRRRVLHIANSAHLALLNAQRGDT